MASPAKPDRANTWFDRQQMADALDISVSYFDREVRRHARTEQIRKVGRKTLCKARPLIEAYLASQLTRSAKACDYTLPVLISNPLNLHGDLEK